MADIATRMYYNGLLSVEDAADIQKDLISIHLKLNDAKG